MPGVFWPPPGPTARAQVWRPDEGGVTLGQMRPHRIEQPIRGHNGHIDTQRGWARDMHGRADQPVQQVHSAQDDQVVQRAERRECARPAVKDFATVRNRSAHTAEDTQPRSRTVMTYREPRPADLESVLEAAPQEFESPILRCLRLRVDHLVQHQITVNDPG